MGGRGAEKYPMIPVYGTLLTRSIDGGPYELYNKGSSYGKPGKMYFVVSPLIGAKGWWMEVGRVDYIIGSNGRVIRIKEKRAQANFAGHWWWETMIRVNWRFHAVHTFIGWAQVRQDIYYPPYVYETKTKPSKLTWEDDV